MKKRKNAEIWTENDSLDAEEETATADKNRKRGRPVYHVCGHRADTGEDRRIIEKPTLGQAKKAVETCKELMPGECASFWLERVQRIEM